MARASSRAPRIISPPSGGRTSGGRTSPIAFLQETYQELRKSVWPSREETARLTSVVMMLAVAAGFFLGGLDRVFSELFNRVIFGLGA
jgi:preprotein translocase SecE subunit